MVGPNGETLYFINFYVYDFAELYEKLGCVPDLNNNDRQL